MIEVLGDSEKGKMQIQQNADTHLWRNSTQPLLPVHVAGNVQSPEANYNMLPFHSLGVSKIFSGFSTLAQWIAEQKTVVIDGYGGVFFEDVQSQIQSELDKLGYTVNWQVSSDFFKPEAEIEELVGPFLGGKDDVWGFKASLELKDFFDQKKLATVNINPDFDINIIIGVGAALASWDAPVIYFDIPKNEIQYRMRAKSITNLGRSTTEKSFNMYKRFYFVDWVVMNSHKEALLADMTIVADGQRSGDLSWMFKQDLEEGLSKLSETVFRVRPWFERGSWGGQWMKQHLEGLNTEEVNYAWSFELITPENGLMFESDGNLLEVSFDFLMFMSHQAVLGKHAELFGSYFPIRFDFLDTFNGGNLSIQCHPSRKYISETFGEDITQDETYYILDCKPDAKVYLGFQEDINPAAFRQALESSQAENKPIEVEKYVQSFPSRKHELFLIPNGTVHSSGVDNMVLEISATPYIFTFKMYDWLSLDLNGKPRPININHAFNNLRFERKGDVVREEHISKQQVIESGEDWELIHLPTHRDHFYDVHRMEFDTAVTIETDNVCHVLMLVEGTAISVKIDDEELRFNYAETFIVPAAAASYTLINHGQGRAKVIKAFLKDHIEL